MERVSVSGRSVAPAIARHRAEPPAPVDRIQHLQASAGNRAVTRLLQRYDTPEHVRFGAEATPVTVGGVELSQGEMIAMADFFADVAQMEAHPDQVRAVLAAMRSGRADTAEWQAATGGRYLELALDNESHFAPSNRRLVPTGGGGRTDHYQQFAQGHGQALWLAATGDQEAAQAHNSFACHFLTDAFSAGHVVNKADVMQRFLSRLTDREDFLDAVAARAWRNERVRQRMSIREMTDFPHLNFDSEWMFARFLRGVDEQRPEVVPNSIALAVHDRLNALIADPDVGGLEVTNDHGDSWRLSGDETLHRSEESLRIGRAAVAQANANLAEVADLGAPAMTAAYSDELLARVWAYVPRPTTVGEAQIHGIVEQLTDPSQQELIDTLGDELANNIGAIIEAAEAEDAIRVEPEGVLDQLGREWERANDWRNYVPLYQ